MIRIGDISDDGELVAEELHRFEPGGSVSADQFLRPGDVLFPNRGTRTTALAFELPLENVIVGAQFFVLRPNQKMIDPAYLAWCLRSTEAAQYFHTCRRGTLVQTLQTASLAEFEIPLPPLPDQSRIVELDQLALQERKLSRLLEKKQSLLLQTALQRFAKKQSR
ncbi:restriction endonuclease subunit S [Haloferula sp. BvORR071]|uniref:restriction endonuclease subunit S n=1 Tax=Haloferula sp. BvORR071 TaxID=1396141 RepID=UPI00054E5433|nr:restriction endonuclease subunit S [Haloferula sp. BvORR071]